MTRTMLLSILLLATTVLSGCGIRGSLDRPPPLWGEAESGDVPQETTAAEAVEDTGAVPDPDARLDPDEDEEDDPGYGIDVAR